MYSISGMGNYIAGTIPCGVGQDPLRGMSGLGCDCNGQCSSSGMGLFESGLDVSGWSFVEWAVIFGGFYALTSIAFTTQRGVRAVRAIPGQRRKAKAAYYRKKASELSKRK